jgi:hypothetical protein
MLSFKQNIGATLFCRRKCVPIRGMCKVALERVKQVLNAKRELNIKLPEDWYRVSQNVSNYDWF